MYHEEHVVQRNPEQDVQKVVQREEQIHPSRTLAATSNVIFCLVIDRRSRPPEAPPGHGNTFCSGLWIGRTRGRKRFQFGVLTTRATYETCEGTYVVGLRDQLKSRLISYQTVSPFGLPQRHQEVILDDAQARSGQNIVPVC